MYTFVWLSVMCKLTHPGHNDLDIKYIKRPAMHSYVISSIRLTLNVVGIGRPIEQLTSFSHLSFVEAIDKPQ